MKKLALILAFVMLLSIGGAYAVWRYATQGVEPKAEELPFSVNGFDYPEMVYITNVAYLSGNGTYTKASYHENVLQSSVTVPRGTELTFRIEVYNNTNVVQGFDAVVSQLGSYDNTSITYTLTNLKRPYTMDGVLAEDVTRISAKQRHNFEITFQFADGVTNFSNATLNSLLKFVFKPFNEIDPEHFTSPVDGALEAFKKILNTPEDYARLDGIMDQSSTTGAYVGNVVGSSDNDSNVLADLFDGNLNLMLTDAQTGELVRTNLTCMIKEEDLDGDGKKEMTIYMTPDNLANASMITTIKNVYAAVFTQVTVDGKTQWEQLGDLYHGTARCNDYDSNIFNGFDPSINTDNWRSSQTYHNVKSNSTIENVIAGYKKNNK